MSKLKVVAYRGSIPLPRGLLTIPAESSEDAIRDAVYKSATRAGLHRAHRIEVEDESATVKETWAIDLTNNTLHNEATGEFMSLDDEPPEAVEPAMGSEDPTLDPPDEDPMYVHAEEQPVADPPEEQPADEPPSDDEQELNDMPATATATPRATRQATRSVGRAAAPAKPAPTARAPRAPRAAAAPATERKPRDGVIATIKEAIARDKGASHDEILAILERKFPERQPESMSSTIKIQAAKNATEKERDTKRGLVYYLR